MKRLEQVESAFFANSSKKRGALILTFVFLVFSLGLISAFDSEVHNKTIQKEYNPDGILSGTINISLGDVPASAIITSNRGHNMTLRDFLKLNKKALQCESFNCTGDLRIGASSTSLNVNYPFDDKFGFYLKTDRGISVTSIRFDVVSDFLAGNSLPLALDIVNLYKWEFLDYVDNFVRSESMGCFQFGENQEEFIVTENAYCEEMDLPRSGAFFLGGWIFGSTESSDMKMSIGYDPYTSIEECSFDPIDFNLATEPAGCVIPEQGSGDFEGGEYLVCLWDEDNKGYKIIAEREAPRCGFTSESYEYDSVVDYALVAKAPQYAPATDLNFDSSDSSQQDDIMAAVNTYLDERYDNDCSEGCIIPVFLEGVEQNLEIKNISILFDDYPSVGTKEAKKAYIIDEAPLLVDFSGILNLSYLGFGVGNPGNKTIEISIDGDEILSERISVLPAPEILNVYPLIVPRGVPALIVVETTQSNNITKYEWNFGDGKTGITTNDSVIHAYDGVGNKTEFNLTIKVTNGDGYSSEKTFKIETEAPADYLNRSVSWKKVKVAELLTKLNSWPSWYSSILKRNIGLQNKSSALDRIDSERKQTINDAKITQLAKEVYDIDVPFDVYPSESISGPFIFDATEIEPGMVSEAYGDSGNMSDIYRGAIFDWVLENVEGDIDKKQIVMSSEAGIDSIMTIYDISFKLDSEGGVFIIQEDFSDLFYDPTSTGDLDELGEGAYHLIEPSRDYILRFGYSGDGDVPFFISPRLSSLNVVDPGDIKPCNDNFICEKDLGEDYKNCRNDCKPLGWTIFWICIVIFFGLVIYGFLQYWYKTKYETRLFRDRNHLFNLVNFIDNSKAVGKRNGEIRRALGARKWPLEQINYAMKKSAGKDTGMFDLIPLEFFMSLKRKGEAKQRVKEGSANFVPPSPGIMPLQGRPPIRKNQKLNKPIKFRRQYGNRN